MALVIEPFSEPQFVFCGPEQLWDLLGMFMALAPIALVMDSIHFSLGSATETHIIQN